MEHEDDTPADAADDGYPSAPVPPHERTWRHPSELGGVTMTIVDQRPLVSRPVAAGVAVAALVFVTAMSRLMVPGNDSDLAVSVVGSNRPVTLPHRLGTTPTTLSGTATEAPAATDSGPVEFAPESTVPPGVATGDTLVVSATTSAPEDVGTTAAPPNTAMLSGAATAVEVSPGAVYVTTSAAIGSARTAPVALDDGSTVEADVVLVDEAAGIAVLVVPSTGSAATSAATLPPGTADAAPGDAVTVLTPSLTQGVIGATPGANGVLELLHDGSATIGEGVPVVDDDGNLVGLCTESGERVWIVPATSLNAAITAGVSDTPWLGVEGARHDAGGVTITAVEPDSPASLAGLLAGDVIVAVDNRSVLSLSELAFDISHLAIGDTIDIDVTRDGVALRVSVTLAVRPDGA